MTPCVGAIVLYRLTAADADEINRRRDHARAYNGTHQVTGVQIHVGNPAKAGERFPMIVTHIFSNNSVNGQVLLDGADSYWATSVKDSDLSPVIQTPAPPAVVHRESAAIQKANADDEFEAV